MPGSAARRSTTCWSACEIATALGVDRPVAVARGRHQLRRARTICARRRRRLEDGLGRLYYERCPTSRSCSSNTSSSSRRSTPPTSPTGARRCCSASELGDREPACWSTSVITRRASTSSRSSRCSRDEERLGGFHFNNRKYADDDLIVGSVNPFELFLIFCELVTAGRDLPRLTIDQSHNIEPKVEAMVSSVVNLQEAYAKALLVDRDALAATQAAGDVLGGHETPARRLQHRRPAAVRDGPRGEGRRRGSGGRAARVGLRGEGRRRAGGLGIGPGRGRRGGIPMSVITSMVAPVEDRWPADRRPAERRAGGGLVRLAPARVKPGGRQLRRREHVGQGHRDRPRRPRGRGRCGSRARAATWRRCPRRTSPPLRLDEILPLFERDAMSDEEMVAYLARCQLDPAAPRSSIETLLHAFIPAAHVHHTHPDAINVLACRRRRRRADRRVLRRPGGLGRLHPPGLRARQAGRRGRARRPEG